ncbi:chaperone protein DnaJ, partial [mine drainage metagenome]
GFFKMVSVVTCKTCGGTGKIPVEQCPTCKGSGTVTISDSVSINIPKGAPDNVKIRFRGHGQSQNGRTGDLYVIISIADEPGITRRGNDIYMQQEISFSEAALGTELEMNLFRERITLKVPAGTQPGESLRIRGSGFPIMNSNSSGDLHVRIMVSVPKKLNAREKELIVELGQMSPKKHSWF